MLIKKRDDIKTQTHKSGTTIKRSPLITTVLKAAAFCCVSLAHASIITLTHWACTWPLLGPAMVSDIRKLAAESLGLLRCEVEPQEALFGSFQEVLGSFLYLGLFLSSLCAKDRYVAIIYELLSLESIGLQSGK